MENEFSEFVVNYSLLYRSYLAFTAKYAWKVNFAGKNPFAKQILYGFLLVTGHGVYSNNKHTVHTQCHFVKYQPLFILNKGNMIRIYFSYDFPLFLSGKKVF